MEHKCLSPWKGAIAGGLIVFIWSSVSWMALPFHEKSIVALPEAAKTSITENISRTGVYILHNDPAADRSAPFVFLSFNEGGWSSMGAMMFAGLLLFSMGAFFWTWILGKIPGLTMKSSALYGVMFGLSVGVLGAGSNWVWWKFPSGFTLLYVLDDVIAWTIASVVIARWCQASACAITFDGKRPE